MTGSPLQRLRLVWGALVAGVVTYTTLAWAFATFRGVGIDLLPAGVMNAAGAAAIAMMASALLVRRTLVQKIPHDLPADERIARYQTATLVGLASLESVGLLVISLALVSGATSWILAGGGAAAVLMVTARPREAEIGLD